MIFSQTFSCSPIALPRILPMRRHFHLFDNPSQQL
jgi:hypothetical protein